MHCSSCNLKRATLSRDLCNTPLHYHCSVYDRIREKVYTSNAEMGFLLVTVFDHHGCCVILRS